MQDNINQFRFFVPSIVFGIVIFSLNPDWWSIFVSYQTDITGSLIKLVGGSLLLLTLGFVISSAGYSVVNFFGWTITEKDRKDIGYSSWKTCLSKGILFQFAKKEYEDWKELADEKHKYIREQIDTRWHMFMADFNIFIAIIFAEIISIVVHYLPSTQKCGSLWLYLLFLVVASIFAFNAWRAYVSVHAITKSVRGASGW